MKILFVGYSNLLKKRILPILDNLDFIDSVDIAKYSEQSWDDSYKCTSKPVRLFENYEDAVKMSNATLAYISTTNSSHFIWAKKFLNAGMHTIIDKPATIHLSEVKELIDLATGKGLLLSEALVYTYHPQMSLIKKILEESNSKPKLLTVQFSFPPMEGDNFRYKKELGGGALLDTSPYAVSIGRYFFGTVPESCTCLVNEMLNDDLEISYSLLMKYPHGRSLIGHFSFNTEYINRLNILGEGICIDIDRIFTIPDSMANTITVKIKNQTARHEASAGNTFISFFNAVWNSISNNSYSSFYNDMYADAFARELIYTNIKTNKNEH
jgi:dTDP-3,4-didehydro-2,6-dideoxy-alpha-D-glucose 3-reductase